MNLHAKAKSNQNAHLRSERKGNHIDLRLPIPVDPRGHRPRRHPQQHEAPLKALARPASRHRGCHRRRRLRAADHRGVRAFRAAARVLRRERVAVSASVGRRVERELLARRGGGRRSVRRTIPRPDGGVWRKRGRHRDSRSARQRRTGNERRLRPGLLRRHEGQPHEYRPIPHLGMGPLHARGARAAAAQAAAIGSLQRAATAAPGHRILPRPRTRDARVAGKHRHRRRQRIPLRTPAANDGPDHHLRHGKPRLQKVRRHFTLLWQSLGERAHRRGGDGRGSARGFRRRRGACLGGQPLPHRRGDAHHAQARAVQMGRAGAQALHHRGRLRQRIPLHGAPDHAAVRRRHRRQGHLSECVLEDHDAEPAHRVFGAARAPDAALLGHDELLRMHRVERRAVRAGALYR